LVNSTQKTQVYVNASPTNVGVGSIAVSNGSEPIITIQFKSPSSLGVGVYKDTIEVHICYDSTCASELTGSPQQIPVTYTVPDTAIVLSSLSPGSVPAESNTFTMTVTGSNFTPFSTIIWDGVATTTTYVSPSKLSNQILSQMIVSQGAISVSVQDPANGPSNTLAFTIAQPILAIGSMSPTIVTTGSGAFMLTVLGTGYTPNSTIMWNGLARPTKFVSYSELIAQIPATDIASTGSATVTVNESSNSAGISPPQTLTISKPSVDAVAFQINPAHTGAINFANVTLPSTSAWTATFPYYPSYALAADGLVFVTYQTSSPNSELVALDQATGATVWGPVPIPGSVNATYDAGAVFVLSVTGTIIETPEVHSSSVEAFDAKTGALLWNSTLFNQYAFTDAPTASNGIVFVGGSGFAGTLYALDEKSGTVLWTELVQNGEFSIPAVTPDGVYVSYSCWTYDFRPLTGETIWSDNEGCEGGGGATPVVSNGVAYSPNGIAGYSGMTFSAETGVSSGTFTANATPAFTATTGFYLQGGTLTAVNLISNATIWTFAGDGGLQSSPIIVNQYVFISSYSGLLYGLDAVTGAQVWQGGAATRAPQPSPAPNLVQQLPFSGLTAGDGLLLVPWSTTLTAYVLSTSP
jgi:outer membrane protein assembly factor BamB